MDNKTVPIIGVLEDGANSLNPQAIQCLQAADLVIGSPRFIQRLEEQGVLSESVEKKDFSGQLLQVPLWIENALARRKQVVVLATGDPLCHGIGAFLVKKLGIETLYIIPNISMIQVAFSRLGIAWQQAKISSIHSKDRGEWTKQSGFDHGMHSLLEDCQHYDLIACYTSPENTPARIADMLQKENMQDDFQCVIAEHLTCDSEQVSDWLPISKVIANDYAEPNVVILQRIKAAEKPVLLGCKDETYFQRKPDKGLITKQEIRAVSLAKMQLKRNSMVWDIGAGSGSMGLEAAHLCSQGRVYAIEKNAADYAIVQQNLAQSSLSNYHIEQGKAPEGLYKWPDADAIFIGGSGGNLADLIRLCLSRLTANGTLVMNFVTLENVSIATETLKQLAKESAPPLEWHFIQLQVSRSKPILSMQRLQAENPVYIVSASRLTQE